MTDEKPCHLYLVGHEHNDLGYAVKVGITESLGGRLAQLQTGSCEELVLFYSFRLPSRSLAAEAERRFHEMYAPERIRGEWFSVEPGLAQFAAGSIVVGVLDDRLPQYRDSYDYLDKLFAFAPFHALDSDGQAAWVNDYCARNEAWRGA